MKISLITALQSKIRYECDICHTQKILEFLVMDDKGNMFSICKECREAYLEPSE